MHSIIEADEEDTTTDGQDDGTLRATVDFLDHFDEALDVVVGCARKTEMARWNRLFAVVGKPKTLFQASNSAFPSEVCLLTAQNSLASQRDV